MANYTESTMTVILPINKVKDFEKLFIKQSNDDETSTFYRTYLNRFSIEDVTEEEALLKVEFECAWSVYACMIEDNEDYPKLEEVIKEFNVRELIIYSRETGVGFEESVFYESKGQEMVYDSRELFYDPLSLYLG